jgi:predicted AAA+ superfamily ATPase
MNILRDIDQELIKWKKSRSRRPLLVRGARQVGKTYSITEFAKAEFENHVTVNFEERPEFSMCFESLDTKEIVEKISVLSESEISARKTLLFFDEIQECPKAILALRYFYEKVPELHVIAAGSLVEFAFKSSNFRMPVGRITFLFMGPLSFDEFLGALGVDKLRQYLGSVNIGSDIDPLYDRELVKFFRKYLIIGGMPGVVADYLKGISPEEINMVQTSIIKTYQADFSKYSSTAKHKYLKDVFISAPRMVGERYKYSRVNPGVQSRDLKEALQLLEEAQCLNRVIHSAGHGVPLGAQTNEKKFKILFLDVGLMQRSLGLSTELMFNDKLMTANLGAVVEQYVGQEILAANDCYEERNVYFWARDAKGSSAEVDYLVTSGSMVYPVEVKSGKTGTLKSMRLFLKEHPSCPFGIRFSMQGLSLHDRILSVPLYLVRHWERLVKSSY